MSTLTSYASAAARDSAAPAASSTGLCIFRSDTKAIEVSDGTNYLTYNNDGFAAVYSSNSYSGFFDGTNDYIDLGSVSQFNSASDLSICFYVRFSALPSAGSFIVSSGSSFSNNLDVFSVGNKIRARYSGSSTVVQTSSSFSLNTWYHVAYVKSGTSSTIYIDGTSDATGTGASTTTSTAGNSLKIGDSPHTSPYRFSGYLDEVFGFDYALSSAQVSNIVNNYSYTSPTFAIRLENDVTDASGNYNGTNNGVTFSTSEKPY